jgi:hypothetical protein
MKPINLFGMVGAGFSGTWLYNNGGEGAANQIMWLLRSSGLLGGTAGAEKAGSGNESAIIASLSRQVENLSQAVAMSNRQGSTIVLDRGGSRMPSFSVILVLGVTGGAYVIYRRGFSLSDIPLVTTRTLGKAIGTVSQAIDSMRANFAESIDTLTGRTEEVKEELGAIHVEVGQVQAGVENLGLSVEEIQRQIRECNQNLLEAKGQHDYACRGINLLCNVVAMSLKKSGNSVDNTPLLKEISSFVAIPPASSIAGTPMRTLLTGTSGMLSTYLPSSSPPVSRIPTPTRAPDEPQRAKSTPEEMAESIQALHQLSRSLSGAKQVQPQPQPVD